MKKEISETIMNWSNDPILDSVDFKSVKTSNEEGKPVLYASFRFAMNNTKITIEKRIPLHEINVNNLMRELQEIDNSLNINEISKLKKQ